MAIQTIKATIQMRKGLECDFDADQMTAGEWAVSTDEKYVRMCFAPGIVLRMATYEAFEQDMVEIQTILATCRDIQAAVERFEQLAEQHKNDAASSALLSESWAHGETGIREGEIENNSKYWSEQSKSEADRAKEEADKAALIAGISIDSELSEISTNPVQNKVITKALNNIDIDVSSKTVNFIEATIRENIISGEKIPVLFGKIKKWFTDFSKVAFSGNYNDLSNKPPIPAAVAVKGNAETNYRTGNVNLTPANIGAIAESKIVKSTNITQEGFLMDGKTASDALAQLNSKLIFSTAETVIGTWVDGRTIYRKCFIIGQLANATSTTRAHGIPNLDRFVHLYGSAKDTTISSGFTVTLPYNSASDITKQINLGANKTNVVLYHAAGNSKYYAVVVMEYIKL